MGVPDTLDAGALMRVIVAFRDALRSHQDGINRLNVYPVPDGDTGTNMALTLESVVAELVVLDAPDLAAVCKAISHGSLMGARGNSGVILSQLLRGIADGIGSVSGPGPIELAAALAAADELARQAVMRPVEGTILTVARGAARSAADAAEAGKSLVEVADASRQGAAEALERTPDLLPVLARAGVVDAGGTGLLLLFDALLHVLDGRPVPDPPDLLAGGPDGRDRLAAATASDLAIVAAHDGGGEIAGLRYEVMYLLEAPDDTIPAFKEVWAGLGDSIVVVGGDGLWNCHIHTDEVGPAIEAALDGGRPVTSGSPICASRSTRFAGCARTWRG
jgi:DAK2 domain fusion protein YloV